MPSSVPQVLLRLPMATRRQLYALQKKAEKVRGKPVGRNQIVIEMTAHYAALAGLPPAEELPDPPPHAAPKKESQNELATTAA